ncbi:MAG TPA: hypothetical protein VN176_08665 [Verrucomicrobiae bacterium]|jgi:hypothetical protein|nr:hypothetical protein [Verrucomicrobiae bacterium]
MKAIVRLTVVVLALGAIGAIAQPKFDGPGPIPPPVCCAVQLR